MAQRALATSINTRLDATPSINNTRALDMVVMRGEERGPEAEGVRRDCIWKNLADYAKLRESTRRLDELFDQYRSKAIATGIGLLL